MGACEPLVLRSLLALETRVVCPVCGWQVAIRSWSEHEARAVFDEHLPLHDLLHPYVLAERHGPYGVEEPQPMLGESF